MTILFSAANSKIIIMEADSAITTYSDVDPVYDTGRKIYVIPGVGCISTWGERSRNTIGPFIERNGFSKENTNITELVQSVFSFLRDEFQPLETGLEDVGYHIGGFDNNGNPHLAHVFFGTPTPNPDSLPRFYYYHDHSPQCDGVVQLVYNGRNDLAYTVINKIVEEMRSGKEVRFNLSSNIDLLLFGDFVTRFSAEMSPEVGPPFFIKIIGSDNRIEELCNDSYSPLNRDHVAKAIRLLGAETSVPVSVTNLDLASTEISPAQSIIPSSEGFYVNRGGTISTFDFRR